MKKTSLLNKVNSNSKRNTNDYYQTPYSMTQQLINAEKKYMPLNIHEPACGAGAIVSVLQKNGFNCTFSDITNGVDFVKDAKHYDACITNPPYKLAHSFIVHAMQITNYIAMLLPLNYLHGHNRYVEIYSNDFNLSHVYVFTRYPYLTENISDTGLYSTGMIAYAWYVWDRKRKSTELSWLDNNKFCISKKKFETLI